MNHKLKITLFATVLLVIAGGTALLSYRLSDFTFDNAQTNAIAPTQIAKKDIDTVEEEVVTVNASTKFVFEESYDNADSKVKTTSAPTEFLGFDQNELEKTYKEWTIESYSDEEVKFTRHMTLPEPMYVLASDEDELVVYYKDEQGNITIEERTGIFTNTLPEADANKLKLGIVYNTKSDMLKALQNYDN